MLYAVTSVDFPSDGRRAAWPLSLPSRLALNSGLFPCILARLGTLGSRVPPPSRLSGALGGSRLSLSSRLSGASSLSALGLLLLALGCLLPRLSGASSSGSRVPPPLGSRVPPPFAPPPSASPPPLGSRCLLPLGSRVPPPSGLSGASSSGLSGVSSLSALGCLLLLGSRVPPPLGSRCLLPLALRCLLPLGSRCLLLSLSGTPPSRLSAPSRLSGASSLSALGASSLSALRCLLRLGSRISSLSVGASSLSLSGLLPSLSGASSLWALGCLLPLGSRVPPPSRLSVPPPHASPSRLSGASPSRYLPSRLSGASLALLPPSGSRVPPPSRLSLLLSALGCLLLSALGCLLPLGSRVPPPSGLSVSLLWALGASSLWLSGASSLWARVPSSSRLSGASRALSVASSLSLWVPPPSGLSSSLWALGCLLPLGSRVPPPSGLSGWALGASSGASRLSVPPLSSASSRLSGASSLWALGCLLLSALGASSLWALGCLLPLGSRVPPPLGSRCLLPLGSRGSSLSLGCLPPSRLSGASSSLSRCLLSSRLSGASSLSALGCLLPLGSRVPPPSGSRVPPPLGSRGSLSALGCSSLWALGCLLPLGSLSGAPPSGSRVLSSPLGVSGASSLWLSVPPPSWLLGASPLGSRVALSSRLSGCLLPLGLSGASSLWALGCLPLGSRVPPPSGLSVPPPLGSQVVAPLVSVLAPFSVLRCLLPLGFRMPPHPSGTLRVPPYSLWALRCLRPSALGCLPPSFGSQVALSLSGFGVPSSPLGHSPVALLTLFSASAWCLLPFSWSLGSFASHLSRPLNRVAAPVEPLETIIGLPSFSSLCYSVASHPSVVSSRGCRVLRSPALTGLPPHALVLSVFALPPSLALGCSSLWLSMSAFSLSALWMLSLPLVLSACLPPSSAASGCTPPSGILGCLPPCWALRGCLASLSASQVPPPSGPRAASSLSASGASSLSALRVRSSRLGSQVSSPLRHLAVDVLASRLSGASSPLGSRVCPSSPLALECLSVSALGLPPPSGSRVATFTSRLSGVPSLLWALRDLLRSRLSGASSLWGSRVSPIPLGYSGDLPHPLWLSG
ncbi:hypothetical protein C7M84_022761 [Penaeus vannamei]|uniref:Uncharacterized protein n=1 Tax=Penaeus vannamei TaxID=6689 RepID=A0A3R7QYZ4_PENVA|nr:hypothetical protein C7M84_022761 [Penaeus vannamei]